MCKILARSSCLFLIICCFHLHYFFRTVSSFSEILLLYNESIVHQIENIRVQLFYIYWKCFDNQIQPFLDFLEDKIKRVHIFGSFFKKGQNLHNPQNKPLQVQNLFLLVCCISSVLSDNVFTITRNIFQTIIHTTLRRFKPALNPKSKYFNHCIYVFDFE